MTPTDPPARRQTNDPKDPLVQMNVRLPKSVRDQIDARRSVKDMSRDLWVTNAVRFALAQHQAPTVNTGGRTAPPPHRR